MQENTEQIKWLLEGDPSIRYQALRDLCDADALDIVKERKLTLQQGWGKQLIDKQ